MLFTPSFKLCECFFDRIQVWRVRREICRYDFRYIADIVDTLSSAMSIVKGVRDIRYLVMMNPAIVHDQNGLWAWIWRRMGYNVFFKKLDEQIGIETAMDNLPIDKSIIGI